MHSYAVRKPSLHEQAVLRKVTFLRRVEQAEWEEAPSEQRGQVATLRKWVLFGARHQNAAACLLNLLH